MNRAQFEHAIRAAAAVAGEREVIVIGSQAVHAWIDEEVPEAAMRDRVPGLRIIGSGAPRLPNTLCAAVPGIPSSLMTMRLDLAGVAVSAGSACSSGKVAASPVLSAMGVEAEIAQSSIRVSQGLYTTERDIERFLAAWSETVTAKRRAA